WAYRARSAGAPLACGIGRRTALPNMQTFAPSCLVTNVNSSIASSGRARRDPRGRGQLVAEVLEVFVGDDVEAADHRAPRRVVGDARDAEPGGRVDDRVVQAQLVEPVVEKARHHRRRAVYRVGRLPAPEAFHADVAG